MSGRPRTIDAAWVLRFISCVGIGLVVATACWGVWLIRGGHTFAQGIAGNVENGIGTLLGLWAIGCLVGGVVGAEYARSRNKQTSRGRSSMRHSEQPRQGELPQAKVEEMARQIQHSDYYASVQPLLAAVEGKVGSDSQAGTLGFLLLFTDGSWVASYMGGKTLSYELGQGTPPEATLALLNNPEFGDASRPLSVDVPYANQTCDIEAEVKKAHGRVITGMAFGLRCFNFRFPDGLELDTRIVPDPSGKIALRVFFEQW
jgi:hypothetical protein